MSQITGTSKSDVRSAFSYARQMMQQADRAMKVREDDLNIADLEEISNEMQGAVAMLAAYIDDVFERRAMKQTLDSANGNVVCYCGAKYWDIGKFESHSSSLLVCVDCGQRLTRGVMQLDANAKGN